MNETIFFQIQANVFDLSLACNSIIISYYQSTFIAMLPAESFWHVLIQLT